MKSRRLTAIIALAVCCIATSSAVARIWTNNTGQYKIDAELVSFENDVAQLRLQDGRVIPVHITRLSRVDQALLRNAAAAPAKTASDWPRFHGLTGAGNVFAETGLARSWPEGGPKMLWQADGLGDGFSSVTIVDGVIYTAGNRDGKVRITALKEGGDVLWTADNGEAWTGSHQGTRGTPTIDGDRLYHKSPLGGLVCLDAKTGDVKWRKNVIGDFRGSNITWALAETVLIDGDRLICSPGGNGPCILALNKFTGARIWATPSNGEKPGYASPVLIEQDGLRMFLQMTGKSLIGVAADDGRFLFSYGHETAHDVNATDPLHHNGQIFITSGYGAGSEMLKLTVRGRTANVERLWGSKEMDNHHGGVVLKDGCIYGAASKANRGGWVCLDWKSGAKRWAEQGVGKGSVALADNLLFTYSERNKMGIAEVTPDGLTLTGQFNVPSGGDGSSWAHPVVLNGKLYLRHADKLFVYDVSK